MITDSSLSSKIEVNLIACGIKLTDSNKCLANAIAKAVVLEIIANAEVVVSGGSSAGTYKVS